MEFGSRIKRRRQKLNLSQGQVANRLHVSSKTVSHWENGNSYPDIGALIQLSDYFQISLDSLIKEDADMKEYLKRTEVKKGIGLPLYISVIVSLIIGIMVMLSDFHVINFAKNADIIGVLILINVMALFSVSNFRDKFSLGTKLETKLDTSFIFLILVLIIIIISMGNVIFFIKRLGIF